MKKYVVIVAGGKGLRMGSDLPKQFIPFQGKPILMHTILAFYRWDPAIKIILVLPSDHQPYWNMLCRELNFNVPHTIAQGGETRFHSVRNGIACIKEEGLIAVHDGVRPFVSPEVITACFESAMRNGVAIPAMPLVDSIREIDGEDGKSHPVDRTKFVAVQTPQVFRSEILHKAYEQPFDPFFTDDASVVEGDGHPVSLVTGNRENIKITDPFDLRIAEAQFNQTEKEV